MKKAKSSPSRATKPLSKPSTVCPFTGEELEIVLLRRGPYDLDAYQARGRFWYTRVFDSKEALLWHLGHRGGVPPSFPAGPEVPKISVRNREPPAPDPAVEDRAQAKELEDATKEAVDRIVRDVAGR